MNALASTLVRRESVAVPETLLLAAYVAGCLLTWSLLPLLGHWNVPADNLEQLAWVLTPDWGYAKHPPFPTWVLWGFEQVFPHGLPLTYLLGGLQGAMMLAIAWRLACVVCRVTSSISLMLATTCSVAVRCCWVAAIRWSSSSGTSRTRR